MKSGIDKCQTGSVLILAIWTVLILSMLALAVGAHVSANLNMARSLAGRSAVWHIAKAGVESAIADVSGESNSWYTPMDSSGGNEGMFKNVSIGEGSFSVYHLEAGDGGVTVTNFGLSDEEGKIDVNSAESPEGRELLRSLMEIAGGIDSQRATEVVESIADWIGNDEETMKHGAEDGYGKGLNPGYSCHNRAIDCLEEPLLIKGMDEKLFSSVEKHLTSHGTRGSINLNTADYIVLTSLAGARGGVPRHVCEAVAARIVKLRKEGVVFKKAEKAAVWEQLYGSGGRTTVEELDGWHALEWAMGHGMVTVQSGHFSGISCGRLKSGAVKELRIAFVYDREADEIRAWYEE